MKNLTRIIGLCAALALTPFVTGCGTAQQAAAFVIDTATSMSSSTPTQVTTYKDATLVADATTKTIGWLADNADTFHISLATLQQLNAINDSIHDAWLKLKAANDAHQSLNFAAINAALTAYSTYKAEAAIPNPPASVTTPTTATLTDPQKAYVAAYHGSSFGLRQVIALR